MMGVPVPIIGPIEMWQRGDVLVYFLRPRISDPFAGKTVEDMIEYRMVDNDPTRLEVAE